MGVCRLWRDAGYALGALIGGIIALLASLDAAVLVAAILTAASGLLSWAVMAETHSRPHAGTASGGGGAAGARREGDQGLPARGKAWEE